MSVARTRASVGIGVEFVILEYDKVRHGNVCVVVRGAGGVAEGTTT